MSPHARSLRVTLCPQKGPLRLRPGKAGSAAPACFHHVFNGVRYE